MNDDSMSLVDFSLDKYDLWTFVFGVIFIVAFFTILIFIGGLPGKIAERRNHPHAEAVKYTGWIGLFTVFPYIHALIWAIHDSTTVDVRSMPDDFDASGGSRRAHHGGSGGSGETATETAAEDKPADGDQTASSQQPQAAVTTQEG